MTSSAAAFRPYRAVRGVVADQDKAAVMLALHPLYQALSVDLQHIDPEIRNVRSVVSISSVLPSRIVGVINSPVAVSSTNSFGSTLQTARTQSWRNAIHSVPDGSGGVAEPAAAASARCGSRRTGSSPVPRRVAGPDRRARPIVRTRMPAGVLRPPPATRRPRRRHAPARPGVPGWVRPHLSAICGTRTGDPHRPGQPVGAGPMGQNRLQAVNECRFVRARAESRP